MKAMQKIERLGKWKLIADLQSEECDLFFILALRLSDLSAEEIPQKDHEPLSKIKERIYCLWYLAQDEDRENAYSLQSSMS